MIYDDDDDEADDENVNQPPHLHERLMKIK